jgi:hypothetical protein
VINAINMAQQFRQRREGVRAGEGLLDGLANDILHQKLVI